MCHPMPVSRTFIGGSTLFVSAIRRKIDSIVFGAVEILIEGDKFRVLQKSVHAE